MGGLKAPHCTSNRFFGGFINILKSYHPENIRQTKKIPFDKIQGYNRNPGIFGDTYSYTYEGLLYICMNLRIFHGEGI